MDREPKKEQAPFQVQKAKAELGKSLISSQEGTGIIEGGRSWHWSLSTSDGVSPTLSACSLRGRARALAVPST